EPRRRHLGNAHGRWCASWGNDVLRYDAIGAEVLHGGECGAPDDEIVQVRRRSLAVGLYVDVPDRDYAITLVERKRPRGDRTDGCEGERANGDGDRHPEYADEREPGVFDQHAEAELDVEREAAERSGIPSVAHCLAMLLHTAKRGERPASCLIP